MKKIFFASSALLSTGLLHAQADTTAAPLNEVIVTANKVAQKQSTTGKVVTVISKEQLERAAGRTLAQLLNEQAGLTINGALNNMGSNQTVYMRGASAGRTLILIDGIPAYDPSLINGEFDLNLIPLNNIESVEICRGAQSTLYGSDAVAGVINVITTKKDFKKPFNGSATASAGSYNTYRGNVQVYGKQNKLSYTARYAKLNTAGFSAAYDSTDKKGFDNDYYHSNNAAATLQYQLSNEFSVNSFVQYSQYKTELDAGIFTDEKDYAVKNKNLMAGAGFKYNKANLGITGNYQYSHINRNYFNDSTDVPGFARFTTDDYFGRSQFAEVYTNVVLNKNFTLLQGADYRYSSMRSNYLSLSSFGPYTTAFKDTSHSQAALYASLFYKGLNEKLNIELGGRLNVHSRYGHNETYTINPSYSINKHFRIFANMASGFKAPTLYQLYSESFGRQDLKPELTTTYEGGIQTTFNKAQARVVWFKRNTTNGIDFNNVTYKYFNFIKQKVNGIEVETSVQPTQGLTLSANYTYLKPTEQTQSRINYHDTTYTYLLRRPQHAANVTIGYGQKNLYASVTGKYVSSRYDVGGYRKPDVLLDDYFILGAYAEYKLKPSIKLFADAQNLTNKKFYEARGFNAIPFLMNAGATFSW